MDCDPEMDAGVSPVLESEEEQAVGRCETRGGLEAEGSSEKGGVMCRPKALPAGMEDTDRPGPSLEVRGVGLSEDADIPSQSQATVAEENTLSQSPGSTAPEGNPSLSPDTDADGGQRTSTPLTRGLRKLLYRRMRVGVVDGRILVGRLHCIDRDGNIILADTVEYRLLQEGSTETLREAMLVPPPSGGGARQAGRIWESAESTPLGMVLVPVECRTSCEVEVEVSEKLSQLSV